jgi:hypothetical protein
VSKHCAILFLESAESAALARWYHFVVFASRFSSARAALARWYHFVVFASRFSARAALARWYHFVAFASSFPQSFSSASARAALQRTARIVHLLLNDVRILGDATVSAHSLMCQWACPCPWLCC